MKKVFSSSEEVARVWAARSQEEGRTGGGNFFFEGDAIYSYRWSFPVAAMFDAPDGRTFCLVAENAPSTTTAAARSEAKAAARDVGCVIVDLPYIGDIVATIARPKRKMGAKGLSAIRREVEAEVARLVAETGTGRGESFAQGQRFARIADLLRIHAEVAEAFGLKWPAPASAEAFAARARAVLDLRRRMDRESRKQVAKARDEAREREERERATPVPPETELDEWRRGLRLRLHHQPAPGPGLDRTVRARVVNGRFSTADGWSRPLKDFSAMLSNAVLSAAGEPCAEMRLGGWTVDFVDGDARIGRGPYYGPRDRLALDEMLAAAAAGAPRLHAKAVAMMRGLGLAEEAPAGPAP